MPLRYSDTLWKGSQVSFGDFAATLWKGSLVSIGDLALRAQLLRFELTEYTFFFFRMVMCAFIAGSRFGSEFDKKAQQLEDLKTCLEKSPSRVA